MKKIFLCLVSMFVLFGLPRIQVLAIENEIVNPQPRATIQEVGVNKSYTYRESYVDGLQFTVTVKVNGNYERMNNSYVQNVNVYASAGVTNNNHAQYSATVQNVTYSTSQNGAYVNVTVNFRISINENGKIRYLNRSYTYTV